MKNKTKEKEIKKSQTFEKSLVKKNKEKEIKVYFCPKCKSFNVKYIFGLSNIFGVIPRQKCMNCSFSLNGGFPVLVTTKSNLERYNLKKKVKKKMGVRK